MGENRFISNIGLAFFVGYIYVAGLVSFVPALGGVAPVVFRAAILVASLLAILRKPVRAFFRSQFFLVWWLFWSAYTVRMVWDGIIENRDLADSLPILLSYAIGSGCIPALSLSIDDQTLNEFSTRMRRLLCVGLAINLAYIFFVQSATFSPGRAESARLNPISVGNYAAMILLLACEQSSWVSRGFIPASSSRLRAELWFSSLFSIGALVLAGSRGPAIAVMVALAALVSVLDQHRRRRVYRWLCLVFSILAIAYAFGVFGKVEFFVRLRNVLKDPARNDLLSDALVASVDFPLTGAGFGYISFYPHNLFVEAFLLGGVLLGIAYLLLVAGAVWRCAQAIRRKGSWRALLFIHFLVESLFSGSIDSSWMLFGFMILVFQSTAEVTKFPSRTQKENSV